MRIMSKDAHATSKIGSKEVVWRCGLLSRFSSRFLCGEFWCGTGALASRRGRLRVGSALVFLTLRRRARTGASGSARPTDQSDRSDPSDRSEPVYIATNKKASEWRSLIRSLV